MAVGAGRDDGGGHLRERKLLDRSLQMQKDKGDAALLKALSAPLHETKVAQVFAQAAQPDQHDLILVSGAGSAWPLLRSDAQRQERDADGTAD